MVLNNEIRPICDVVAVLSKVEAIVDIKRKGLSTARNLSHRRYGTGICILGMSYPHTAKFGLRLTESRKLRSILGFIQDLYTDDIGDVT